MPIRAISAAAPIPAPMPTFAPVESPRETVSVGAGETVSVGEGEMVALGEGDALLGDGVELDVLETKSVLWYRIETP